MMLDYKPIALLFLLTLSEISYSQIAISDMLWQQQGDLKSPSSVLYYREQNILLVSNENKTGGDRDWDYRKHANDGFISRIKTDGSIEQLKWITGLDNPKGLAVQNNVLYISDGESVLTFDVKTGKPINKFTYRDKSERADVVFEAVDGASSGSSNVASVQEMPEFTYFTSIVIDLDGKLLILDEGHGIVFHLKDGKFAIYMKDERLKQCHKLFIYNRELYALGYYNLFQFSDGDLQDQSERVKDMMTTSITEIGTYDYLMLTFKGGIYRWFSNPVTIVSPHPAFLGNADLCYINENHSIAIINRNLNMITGLKLGRP